MNKFLMSYYNIKYKLKDDVTLESINNLVMYIKIPKDLNVIIEKTCSDGNIISTKTSLSKTKEIIIDLNTVTSKEEIIQIAVKPSTNFTNNTNRINLYTDDYVTINGIVNIDNAFNNYVDNICE